MSVGMAYTRIQLIKSLKKYCSQVLS